MRTNMVTSCSVHAHPLFNFIHTCTWAQTPIHKDVISCIMFLRVFWICISPTSSLLRFLQCYNFEFAESSHYPCCLTLFSGIIYARAFILNINILIDHLSQLLMKSIQSIQKLAKCYLLRCDFTLLNPSTGLSDLLPNYTKNIYKTQAAW